MEAPVRPGDVLAGKYRVDRVLGMGGMGVVVAAHHLELDDRVAIKFLLSSALGNSEAVARFAREARAAVKIKSEHVARVIDVGRLENGAPYIVMEFLDGQDLAAWVHSHGAMSIEQAVEFILQAIEAIAEAHSLGIIHRDLKPANLFCVRRADGQPSIKVLDFGISKMTGLGASAQDMNMTRTTSVMGSPLYMSPEQLESSRGVDARTDIWALGTILYELLTGRVPFAASTLPELVIKVLSTTPPPLRNYRADAPLELERIILRCLERDRNRRYSNVAELAVALLEFGPKRARTSVERTSRIIEVSGLSTSALAIPPSSEARGADATMAPLGRTTAGLPSNKGILWVVAAAAIAIVAGVVVFMRVRGKDAPPAGGDVASSNLVQPAPPAHVEPPPAAPTAAPAPAPEVAHEAPSSSAAPPAPVSLEGRGERPKPGAKKAVVAAPPPVGAAPPAPPNKPTPAAKPAGDDINKFLTDPK